MKNIEQFIAPVLVVFAFAGVAYALSSSAPALGKEEFPNSEFTTGIESMQEEYFDKYGTYRQIVDKNELAGEALSGAIAAPIPDSMYVNVYETPDGGKGYQIIYEDAVNRYGIGYGPDAKSMTWTQVKAVGTTTPTQ